MRNPNLSTCIVVCLLMFIMHQTYSQHYKGTFEISPNVGFTISNQEIDGLTNDFNYKGPEFGIDLAYYFMRKVSIGVCVQGFHYINSNDSKFTSTGAYFGPIVGNSISISEKLNVPIRIGAAYNHYVDDVVTGKFKYNGFGGFGRVGMEYKINRDFFFSFLLGVHFGSLKNDTNGSITELDYVNFDIKAGFSFYL